MKQLLTTAVLLLGLATGGLAQQNQRDSTGSSTPILDEQTKEKARQKVNQAEEKLGEELDRSRSYQQRNQLSWFQPQTVFGGGGIGFGVGNSQVYTAINLRAGYFFQPGFAAGLRYDYDRLIGKSYRARQFGVFARYYPFRTRVSSFIGASLNSGREFAETIAANDKARYTSVGLEIGVMAWILHRLGAEITYEGNFYNKINPAASLGRGGRLKFGVNYYFGQVGRGGGQRNQSNRNRQ